MRRQDPEDDVEPVGQIYALAAGEVLMVDEEQRNRKKNSNAAAALIAMYAAPSWTAPHRPEQAEHDDGAMIRSKRVSSHHVEP